MTSSMVETKHGADRLFEIFAMEDDIVLVTGASSGIGRAAAEIYADAGATVVVLGRNQARLDEVRDGITSAGGRAHVYAANLDQPGAFDEVTSRIISEVGRPTVVVANAGIAGGSSYLTEDGSMARYSDEEWDRVVDTNLNGTFETVRAAARILPDHGRILVTSSTAGLRTDPMVSYAYGATKAAIINLARQAALELAPRGIRVNVIAPGPFKGTRIGGEAVLDEAGEKEWEETIPLGRMGTLAEIQAPMLFLVAPGNSFVTGAVLAVDGGALALSHTVF